MGTCNACGGATSSRKYSMCQSCWQYWNHGVYREIRDQIASLSQANQLPGPYQRRDREEVA